MADPATSARARPTGSKAGPPGPRARSPRVVALTVAVGAAGAALLAPVVAHDAPHPLGPVAVVAGAVLFFASELLLIHIPTRRDVHTVSFSELPLTLGLLTLAPGALVLAAMVGSGIAFATRRAQRGVKLAFNVTQVGAQATVAAFVVVVVRGGASDTSLRTYLALALAALVADLLSALLVSAAITLFRGRTPGGLTLWVAAAGTTSSVTKTGLALLAVSAVVHNDLVGFAMFVVCAAVMYVAFHSYATLYARHRRVDALYQFTRAISRSVDLTSIARAAVEEARGMLHAERAQLVVVGERDAMRCHVHVDESVVIERVAPGVATAAPALGGDGTNALVTALPSAHGAIGHLAVEGRIGMARAFDRVDQQLLDALASHVAVALLNGQLVEQLEIEMLEREHRATHDALTGLANRTRFADAIDTELAAAAGQVFAFVLGLDRFSEINDTLGHDNGDAVLCAIGDRLVEMVPEAGCIARLGGDEFAVLWRADGATSIADAVARLVDVTTRAIAVADLHVTLGVSVGVAIAPDHAAASLALLRCADAAMRTSKETGARYVVYDPDRAGDVRRRMRLAHELRRAIDRRDLTVCYQPKVATTTGTIVGVEVLVRWTHDEFGVVPPDEFVPIAEQVGLIDALTGFVLDTALRQQLDWATSGLVLPVAVNVSARSLGDDGLAEQVTRALARHGSRASELTVEITETQLMADPRRAATALRRLHDLGVRVSIDDFGTGFSSLSSLRDLPLDEIKIDKSFVFGAATNDHDAAIVRSTAQLGHSLGLLVVAEGIEDGGALGFIAACGVDVAQGYHFARPLDAPALERWARERAFAERAARRTA